MLTDIHVFPLLVNHSEEGGYTDRIVLSLSVTVEKDSVLTDNDVFSL